MASSRGAMVKYVISLALLVLATTIPSRIAEWIAQQKGAVAT
jgi:hypothetical protein